MIIAFFSLNTSMYTNIVEQSKEIGVLRAIGVTQYAIFRIYTYESMFLVLSSAFLGVRTSILNIERQKNLNIEIQKLNIKRQGDLQTVYSCSQSLVFSSVGRSQRSVRSLPRSRSALPTRGTCPLRLRRSRSSAVSCRP